MEEGVQIHTYRPERMFGTAFVIWQRDFVTGERQMLKFDDQGNSSWVSVSQQNDVYANSGPTMILDDKVVDALVKHFEGATPSPPIGVLDAVETHLHDAREGRDRMLTMLEAVINDRFVDPMKVQQETNIHQAKAPEVPE